MTIITISLPVARLALLYVEGHAYLRPGDVFILYTPDCRVFRLNSCRVPIPVK